MISKVADCGASSRRCSSACRRSQEHAQAEQLYRRALATRALGPNHADVALTAHNLGICLSACGRHAEALALHKQALAVREGLLAGGSGGRGQAAAGQLPADVLASHRNVGLCLSRQVGQRSVSSACQLPAWHTSTLRLPRQTSALLILQPSLDCRLICRALMQRQFTTWTSCCATADTMLWAAPPPPRTSWCLALWRRSWRRCG